MGGYAVWVRSYLQLPFIVITMEDNGACIDDTVKLGIQFPSQTVQL